MPEGQREAEPPYSNQQRIGRRAIPHPAFSFRAGAVQEEQQRP